MIIVDNREQANKEIKIGDIVIYEDEKCLVIDDTMHTYRYRLLELNSGEVMDGFVSLKILSEKVKFYAHREDLVLTIK